MAHLMCSGLFAWLNNHEGLGVWIEAVALILIFGIDSVEFWRQGKARKESQRETTEQMDIWRKQIHADRVAEIFKVLRAFHNFLIASVHKNKTFGPGRDFSSFGDMGLHPEGKIFPEYLALQEAYYLSYLVSSPLAAYMKERMAEADSLQKIADMDEFYTRLENFNQKWDVYQMAAAIWELS
jgi:hypothetical protein